MNKKRIVGLLLAIAICLGMFPVKADAAVITKANKTYDIAVVFDNSGSMYRNEAWCRAKYAMEIFASMLNYNNGDVLKIFPMWEVTKDGSTPSNGGDYSGFEVKTAADIDQITKLYTVNPSNTPFEPIQEACDYLRASDKSEKWLVILTDGDFNELKRNERAQFNLQKKIEDLSTDGINIQYLGFGEARQLKTNEAKNFYAKKSSDTSLKDDLVSICNTIFQRSVLEKSKLQGNSLTLDLSMKNLIVFVQGENATVNSLKNSDGNEIGILFNSGQRSFSTIKAKGYESAPIDKSLAGQVVTFAGCPKGQYTLDYSGADSIQVFYEPDVDIHLEFTDVNGEVIDLAKDDIVAGEYKLNFGIVDNVTGEDAIASGLLGDVSLNAWVVKEDGEETPIKEDGTVLLEPDQKTYFKVEGTYLKDYKITTEDNKDAYTFEVQYPSEGEFDIVADVLQESSWYKLSKHEDWKPIHVAVAMNGEPLTDEAMTALSWDIKTEDITWHSEMVPGESALNIIVGYDQDGNYVEPESGKYHFTIKATSIDAYERELKDTEEVTIEVSSLPAIWKWMKFILPILVLLILFTIYMSQKVLPKDIVSQNITFKVKGKNISPGGKVSYDRSGKKLKIKSSAVPTNLKSECQATLTLKPVDRRWTSSSSRRIQIVGVSSSGIGVKQIDIGAITYVKDKTTGQWQNSNSPEKPIVQDVKNAFISIAADKANFDCKLKHK